MGQESSRLTDPGPSESRFYLTDIAIERTDDYIEHWPSLNLAELWISGLPGSEAGISFALSKISSRRWEMTNFIELCSVDSIDCVAKCDESESEDVAFMHLERNNAGANSGEGHHQEMETFDDRVHLIMSWRMLEIQPDPVVSSEDWKSWAISGATLVDEFPTTREPAILEKAIAAQQRALQLAPNDCSIRSGLLYALAKSFFNRFEFTGDPGDLSRAISESQRALHLTPVLDTRRVDILSSLALWLRHRFKLTGHLSDVSESISAFEDWVKLTPDTDKSHPKLLNELAGSMVRRFQLTGDVLDIDRAVKTFRKALDISSHGHPIMLCNLGVALSGRFDSCGDMSDLAEAISVLQKAVHITPDGDQHLPMIYTYLGDCFRRRFDLDGELGDLTEAISRHQGAIDLALPESETQPMLLHKIGGSLQCRFKRTGDLTDLAQAISGYQKAIELTPEGSPHLPYFLTDLGSALERRFLQTDNRSDLTQAITVHRRSVQLTPQGNARLPYRLKGLGTALLNICKRTGDMSVRDEAVSVMQRAVDLTPEGHPERPSLLMCLVGVLALGWEFGFAEEDLDESVASLRRAAYCKVGPPNERLSAAKLWAKLSRIRCAESPDILAAYDTVIGLIAIMSGLEKTVQGRYTQLQEVSGLALEAASSACSFHKPEKALEWLEAGRCLVWSQLNNLRTPLDNLRFHDNLLSQRVEILSKQLDNAGSVQERAHVDMPLSQKISLEDAAHTHLKLARQWEDLLRTVRAIPGFESFLQPASCSSLLQNLPESGPIVVINVDGERCDAIALIAGLDEPLHVPLTNFSLTKANKYRSDLHAQLKLEGLRVREADAELAKRKVKQCRSKQVADKEVVCQVLRGLWVEVVKPILDALGFSRSEASAGGQPPRIWWCPTGPLSFLPIHAAGEYRSENQECILDYAVSSYTPTVTAVTDRVRNLRPIDGNISGLFLTSQPNAPGASRIPGTTEEVQLIHEQALDNQARVRRVDGTAVTIDECLEHMENYSCIHLACHASQNASDPLQSRFLFHNGYLDLSTILQRNLKNADLAFLSACQTCTGEEKLSDEAVHLAAGMLAAGYRRVVATMWAIGDQHAPDVANDFYEYLWSHREEGSGVGFDGSLSAHALHQAIQKLRLRLDNSEQSLLSWIPYVHFGY